MTNDELELTLRRFATIVVDEVVDRLSARQPARAAESISSPSAEPATSKQLALLNGWRNKEQLNTVLGGAEISSLTKRQASAILDVLMGPRQK